MLSSECPVHTTVFALLHPPPPRSTLFPYTTLFRSFRRPDFTCGSTAAGVENASCTCPDSRSTRSEEHTSELQSRRDLVCRLLLEKKKQGREASRPGLGARGAAIDRCCRLLCGRWSV